MTKRILVSIGGNALGTTMDELAETAGIIADPVVDLVAEGNEVVICHGNGPQVGYIKAHMDKGLNAEGEPTVNLSECGAMSQAYIGYHLVNALENRFAKRGIDKKAAALVTRVIVDKADPRFQNPTKPIGAFYTEEESKKLEAAGKTVVEDSGRGYREVVASPLPKEIVEKQSILDVIDAGHVVIAGGGGGIPTVYENNHYKAIDAVIDKDRTSVILAADTKCDALVICTGVEKVSVNFNKPNQEDLSEMTLADCERYIGEGQFPEGSMLPKIEAAMDFVKSGEGRTTLITSLDKLVEAMNGETGTVIKA